jgi:heavy metal efflux system protein
MPRIRRSPRCSSCIGLLPAAVSSGIGSQVQRPLATVVVGGMFLGPIIMLVVVPALQTLFLGGRHGVPPDTPAEEPHSLVEV